MQECIWYGRVKSECYPGRQTSFTYMQGIWRFRIGKKRDGTLVWKKDKVLYCHPYMLWYKGYGHHDYPMHEHVKLAAKKMCEEGNIKLLRVYDGKPLSDTLTELMGVT